ncbi:MAG: metal-sensitive transcriptional regulator [Chloroflexota bacterium]|jgi:DNA-binding FrmR family transcriptional regulator|nr:metal-sensitive transcriptional regulator [Chloroflexota bacterium]MDP6507953.1 metal-sensitive transcriptional regulator [Chloroflexota bacterium]MDP6756637.1 metal-sensitive transcriptional regulator [Chloroflexota bacterium]
MDTEIKKSVLARWRSVEGHVHGVERMVENNAYCVDILKQTLAIQGAIEKVNALVLESHLQHCVTTAIRSEDQAERERVISELMDVFRGSGHLKRVPLVPAEIAEMLLAEPAATSDSY